MGKKSTASARKRRQTKYFRLRETNSSGMDNAWSSIKRGKGFIFGPAKTARLAAPARQYLKLFVGTEINMVETMQRSTQMFSWKNYLRL